MISTFILSAAAAIACLASSSNAFSPSVGRAVVNKNSIHNNNQPLFAEAPDGPKDGTTITSARKEIGYDAASARVSCFLYCSFAVMSDGYMFFRDMLAYSSLIPFTIVTKNHIMFSLLLTNYHMVLSMHNHNNAQPIYSSLKQILMPRIVFQMKSIVQLTPKREIPSG